MTHKSGILKIIFLVQLINFLSDLCIFLPGVRRPSLLERPALVPVRGGGVHLLLPQLLLPGRATQ